MSLENTLKYFSSSPICSHMLRHSRPDVSKSFTVELARKAKTNGGEVQIDELSDMLQNIHTVHSEPEDTKDDTLVSFIIEVYRSAQRIYHETQRGIANKLINENDGIVILYEKIQNTETGQPFLVDGPITKTDSGYIADFGENLVDSTSYFVKIKHNLPKKLLDDIIGRLVASGFEDVTVK